MNFIMEYLGIEFVRSKVQFVSLDYLDWIFNNIPQQQRQELFSYMYNMQNTRHGSSLKLKFLLANFQENEHTKLIINTNKVLGTSLKNGNSNSGLQQVLANVSQISENSTNNREIVEYIDILNKLKLTF